MNVRALQRALHALGYDAGPVDGIRGFKTIKATRAAQKDLGLVSDGVAGPMTFAALKAALAKPGKHRKEPNKAAMGDVVPLQPAIAARGKVKRIEIPMTSRSISEIIHHCTATPEGKHFTVKDVTAWHKKRGFSDNGYHFLIYPDGTIAFGRPIGQTGAHCKGRNTGSIGISYFGGVSADGKHAKDTRTPAQVAAQIWLTNQLCKMYPIVRITGHNKYAAKACPSFNVADDRIGNIPGFSNGLRRSPARKAA